MPAAKKAVRPPPIRGFMFDLDGTLLLSDRSLGGYQVLPGAIEVLTRLRERDIPYVVLTNGSAYPPPEQAGRLRDIGLPVDDEQMLTPSSVAAEVMTRDGIRRALILGKPGVGWALEQAGIALTFPGQPDASQVDAVYVGWHPDCHMRDIEAACQAVWGGARLYVASNVPFFATRHGRTMGYSSAIVGAIRHMTHVPMILTGKPSLHALRFVARRLGVKPREVGVVGDDAGVETVMARRLGATAFGVTTGVTDAGGWKRERGLRRPHRVLTGIAELLELPPLNR
ncbi:MAG: HAD hydrolase-like protein [Steroidobacteraceae bacterium]